ncbi:polynucleotide kinase [Gordonia phage Nina]|uniref:Polynucleotide kinase n=1 Tax=Gordonia phage Nina TaxID=2499026 RepID=A0A3S9UN89_9CAUD|nr:polynucleotide kinase [Gordonia phage Nina]
MSVLIEGPDGAGKTTLIRHLMEDMPDLRLMDRFCTSKGGPVDDLFPEVRARSSEFSIPAALFDRHPLWSEYIYSHELGRPIAPGFITPTARSLTRVMKQQCMVILCMPPLERVQANLGHEEQMPGVAEHIGRIYEGYAIRGTQYTGRLYWYDYTHAPSYRDLLNETRQYVSFHHLGKEI